MAGKQPSSGEPHRRKVCKFCLHTKQDREKRDNRFISKMQRATYSHCHKYNLANNTALTPTQFRLKFHWPSYKEMAKRAEVEYNAGCPICPEPENKYLDMNDLTLDIRDTSVDPYWYNTGFMCRTKNSQKSKQTLADFEADNEEWRLWYEWQRKKTNIQYGMLLEDQYALL